MIKKYNRLVYHHANNLEEATGYEAKYRCVGKTTGELLQLIGACNASPEKKFYLSYFVSDFDAGYGSNYKYWLIGELTNLLDKLGFIGYTVNRKDYSVVFSCFGTCKVTVEIID